MSPDIFIKINYETIMQITCQIFKHKNNLFKDRHLNYLTIENKYLNLALFLLLLKDYTLNNL